MFGNVRDALAVSEAILQRTGNLAGWLQTRYEKLDIYKDDYHAGPMLLLERKMISLICCVTVFFALGGSMIAAASHANAAKASRPTAGGVAVTIWNHMRKGSRSFTVDTSALKQKDPFACVFIDNGQSSYGDYIYSEMVGVVYQVTAYCSGRSKFIVFRKTSSESLATETKFLTSISKTTKSLVRKKKGSYQKIKTINSYVKSRVGYDNTRSRFQASDAYFQRKATCSGYVSLMYIMLRDAGIPCRIVKNDSMNHAWILVKSGSRWYQCDPSWDDTARTTRYFMKGRSYSGHKKAYKLDSSSTSLPTIAKHSYQYYAK